MIDPKLQAELRARFNPDGSDLRKMQLRMLEMLKFIDRICRENNIKYWLSSGTCIGAVRHGGFIPWDDDCDIEMEAKDYERFKLAFQNETQSSYILQSGDTDPEYLQRFDKLRDLNSEVKESASTDNWNKYRGCYIDIFTIEPSPSRIFHRICGLIWNYSLFPLAKIKDSAARQAEIKKRRHFLEKLFKAISPSKSKSEIYRHALGSGFNKLRKKADIQETRYIPFEDADLPVPANSDSYLRNIYGEYLELPPVDEIHPHFRSFRII